MTKNRIAIETDNVEPKKIGGLKEYLDDNGFEWKMIKFGPIKTTRKVVGKKRTVAIIPIERKHDFIGIHISLFDKLHEETKGEVAISGTATVREIAEGAKLVLGYSEKTANTDIVRILYDIYKKEIKKAV